MPMRIAAVLVCVATVVLGASFWAPKTEADFYAGLGTVTNQSQITPCSLIEWGGTYSRNFDSSMQSCWSATLHGCGTISDMPFVYAYAPPALNTKAVGTIVMFSGDGGTDAAFHSNFSTYVEAYEGAGYQVVEVALGALSDERHSLGAGEPQSRPNELEHFGCGLPPSEFS